MAQWIDVAININQQFNSSISLMLFSSAEMTFYNCLRIDTTKKSFRIKYISANSKCLYMYMIEVSNKDKLCDI
jgi:hypothetical protein